MATSNSSTPSPIASIQSTLILPAEEKENEVENGGGTAADLEQGIHVLPCHIDFTGPASVSTFFQPQPLFPIQQQQLRLEDNHINASTTIAEKLSATTTTLKLATFRGHLLVGEKMEMPTGYQIYAVYEQGGAEVEGENAGAGNKEVEAEKIFKIHSAHKSLDMWEYDDGPEKKKLLLKDALIALRITADLASY